MAGPRIPVSADPNSAVSAIERVIQAIRRAGQEGRKFADLDLGHPELKDLSDDIRRMQANFQQMKTLGRGSTAAALRSGGYKDFISWHAGAGSQFPDQRDRRYHYNTVASGLLRDTGLEPTAPPDGGQPPGRGGARGPLGGMFSASNMLRWGGVGMALAGIGGVTSSLFTGVNEAEGEAVQLDMFKRQIGDISTDFDRFRNQIRSVGEGLGITYQESVKLAQSFAKVSAESNVDVIRKEVRDSISFARGFGLDPAQSANFYGQMRFKGVTGENGEMNDRQLALTIGEAIGSSGMWSRTDEIMQSIARWVDTSERVMVRAPNVDKFAEFQAMMNASNQPGLRGAGGEAVIAALDNMVRRPGGGESGEFFAYRSLGRREDGSTLNPYEYEYLKEEGAFGTERSAFGTRDESGRLVMDERTKALSAVTNIEKMFDRVVRDYGDSGDKRAVLTAFKQHSGQSISMHQTEELLKLREQHGGDAGWMSKGRDLAESIGIDADKIPAGSVADLVRIAHADVNQLNAITREYFGRKDMTDEHKKMIVGSTGSADEMRKALAAAAIDLGRGDTPGYEAQRTRADMLNQLTRIGDELIPFLNQMRGAMVRVFGSGVLRGSEQAAGARLADPLLSMDDRVSAARELANYKEIRANSLSWLSANPANPGSNIYEKMILMEASRSLSETADQMEKRGAMMPDGMQAPFTTGDAGGAAMTPEQMEDAVKNGMVKAIEEKEPWYAMFRPGGRKGSTPDNTKVDTPSPSGGN